MRIPVNAPYTITTPYGWVEGYPLNTDPNSSVIPYEERKKHPGKGYGFHTGLDIVSKDKKIIAPITGTVRTGYDEKNGKYLVIYDNVFRVWFSHLESYKVTSGTRPAGTVLGIMGETGYADGVHVHFSLRKAGEMVNPSKYIREGEDMYKGKTAKEWHAQSVHWQKKATSRESKIIDLRKSAAKLKEALLKAENNPPKEITKYVDRVVTKVEKIPVVDPTIHTKLDTILNVLRILPAWIGRAVKRHK